MPLSHAETRDRLNAIFDTDDWDGTPLAAEATYLVNALVADGMSSDDDFYELFGDSTPDIAWFNYEDAIPVFIWNGYSVPFAVGLTAVTSYTSYIGRDGHDFIVPSSEAPRTYSCANCTGTFSSTSCPERTALSWSNRAWHLNKFCPNCHLDATWREQDEIPHQAYESLDNNFNWLGQLAPLGVYRRDGDVSEFLIHGAVNIEGARPSYRPEPLHARATPPFPSPGPEAKFSVAEHLKNCAGSVPMSDMLAYSDSPFRHVGRVFLHATKHSPPKNGRYYGVELEWETLGDLEQAVETMAKLMWPFGIITSDSSLRQGAEIKTLPATIAAHRELWKPFFAGKPNKIVRSWASGRCGMHVHVSATSISHLTLGKLNAFFNTPYNGSFINTIAGRNVRDNEYCHPNNNATKLTSAFASKRAQTHFAKIKRVHYAGYSGRVDISHHNAFVSRETNKGTYELRIFRGNLAEGGFMKNLEFTDAVITWAEETPLHSINHVNFCEWMRDATNMARYRYLAAFLEAKSLLSVPVHGRTVYLGEELGQAAD